MTRKPYRIESNTVSRRVQVGIICLCFAAAALTVSAAAKPDPGTEAAMRLIQSSGFDAMLRLDAALDGTLRNSISESMPPELRADIVGALGQTLGYAEMRRGMAETISSRLDAAAIDRHIRWWASSTGQAVSAAHAAAFRELTDPKRELVSRPATPINSPALRKSQLAFQLPKVAGTSRSTRDCMQMNVSLRRECGDTQPASKPAVATVDAGAADIVLSHLARLADGDIAAFGVYLDSPGAKEAMGVLVEAYVQTRSSKSASVHRLIDASVNRFARSKIGAEKEQTLKRTIALIDESKSLEEARLILHLLHSVEPKDPRILVELARVAIKQAPGPDSFPGDPPSLDPEFLEDAQGWMDRAIALNPQRADTLVLAGHLAYMKYQYPESIALLERARQIGTTNPWLRLNLADSWWALGRDIRMDRVKNLNRAIQELQAAMAEGLPPLMQWKAVYSLAHIYADLNDSAKARAQFQRLITTSAGYNKAWIQNDYAKFLLLSAGDVDGAIAAARQAVSFTEFEMEPTWLAQALLVKAGRLYASGKPGDAAKFVQEAQDAQPGLTQKYSDLARLRSTLPAVFALHEARVIGDLSDSEGGLTLVLASAYAGAADMERLIKWRADPNYLDPDEGTPLRTAILEMNLAAIRTLLAHGADMSVRDHYGLMPLEFAERTFENSDPRGAEILAVLRAAAARNPNAAPVGTPLKAGYRYRVLKRIEGSWGSDFEVGEQITFVRNCAFGDVTLACLEFKDPANKNVRRDAGLKKEQLVSWQDWFQEIGPSPASAK